LIPKTDQERVQNLSLKQIEQYAKEQWEITEKVDGSSITMAIIDDEFIVCSRNINLKEDPNNSFWRAARKYRIEEKLRQIDAPIAIQGEIIGPGVQGNQYEREDVEFLCYDIWHMERQRYLTSYERMHITSQYEIPHVPLIMTAPLLSLDIKVLLSLADGQSLINRSPREGLVFKSLTNPMNHFKCVSNEWLLRYE
jgi:RNA ligase (TIGR02306 family)